MEATAYDLPAICRQFQMTGTVAGAEPYGSGHINATYLVRTKESDAYDYILQRVNHNVFKNVPNLMDNILRVTTHVRGKLAKIPGANPDRETLTVIPAKTGKPYHQETDGTFWRMYIFVENTKSYDIVDSPTKAFEGGRMFGRFQKMLFDLPGGPLHETIPEFHNIAMRLERFRETLARDPKQRAASVRNEISFVEKRAEEMQTILRLGRDGKIPLRVTHNDTKFNNVLLDANDKGLCVIDLDTVMPGYVHFDFGDSLRTVTNTAAEDEKDTSKVSMNIDLFEGYAKGYLSEAKDFLTPVEVDNLALAARVMTFIIGLSFLTDYIDGDNYFKIIFPEHNIQRTRAQFKLLSSMEEQYDEMRKIVAANTKR
ncbi:MAG: aminoglycoside phosphotransferase family protein [Spirochaetes bacterium]|nr:aminoglycoside phosphotransferase family protein [Spirochaetota bacterium]